MMFCCFIITVYSNYTEQDTLVPLTIFGMVYSHTIQLAVNKWPLLHNYQRYVQFPLLCQCGATDNNLKVQTSLRERVMLSKGESAIDVTMGENYAHAVALHPNLNLCNAFLLPGQKRRRRWIFDFVQVCHASQYH